MNNTIKCEGCKEEMLAQKAYAFFDHKKGEWHSGHKLCMNSLQLELEYPRQRA